MRPAQHQGADSRSGRSRSKSCNRYEEFHEQDELDGSEKVQIADAPKIKEGTPLLRRAARPEEQQSQAKNEDSIQNSSFAELTKQQTLIQQSFKSHQTLASAAKPNAAGKSPPARAAMVEAMMGGPKVVQNQAEGVEVDQDLMTFQQKRRPTQQDHSRGMGNPLEVQEAMLPRSRFTD